MTDIEAAAAEEMVLSQFVQEEDPQLTVLSAEAKPKHQEPTLPYENGAGARQKRLEPTIPYMKMVLEPDQRIDQCMKVRQPREITKYVNMTEKSRKQEQDPSNVPQSKPVNTVFQTPYCHTSFNPTTPVWYCQNMNSGPTTAQYVEMQQKLIDVMGLPKSNLMKFDGDPMQYWTFMNAQWTFHLLTMALN